MFVSGRNFCRFNGTWAIVRSRSGWRPAIICGGGGKHELRMLSKVNFKQERLCLSDPERRRYVFRSDVTVGGGGGGRGGEELQ